MSYQLSRQEQSRHTLTFGELWRNAGWHSVYLDPGQRIAEERLFYNNYAYLYLLLMFMLLYTTTHCVSLDDVAGQEGALRLAYPYFWGHLH